MRVILLAIMLVGPSMLALSDSNSSKQSGPVELQALKNQYENNIRRVTEPIDRKYLSSLERLKKKFGANGDIQNAVAVQKEIDHITDVPRKETVSGKWVRLKKNGKVVDDKVYMELFEDGRFEVKGQPRWSGKYTFENPEKTILRRICNNKREFRLFFDKAARKLTQNDGTFYMKLDE